MPCHYLFSYQLDEGHPYFLDYCRERHAPCVDLLPNLERHPKDATFILNSMGANDVWHLTVFGHGVAAEEIRQAL